MHLSAILKSKSATIVSTRPGATVGETVNLLNEHRIGAVLVLDAERIVGIFSERDFVRGFARHGAAVAGMEVARLMTRDVITSAPGESVREVMSIMTQRRIRHLPVVDAGRLVGIISIGDVVKYRLEETESEVESLRDYVMTAH
jgi:CBS domain-containing protein